MEESIEEMYNNLYYTFVDGRKWFYKIVNHKSIRVDESKINRKLIDTFEKTTKMDKRVDVYRYQHVLWTYNGQEAAFNEYTKKLLHKDDCSPIGGPLPLNIDKKEYLEARTT